MRLQGRSEPGTKTLMDEKQSKNDEFSNHLLLHKIHTVDPTQSQIDSQSIEWQKFDVLMLEKVYLWMNIPLNSKSSFNVGTTKEDIILNVCKNVLNEVQTQYQYWNNFIQWKIWECFYDVLFENILWPCRNINAALFWRKIMILWTKPRQMLITIHNSRNNDKRQ